MKMKQAFSLMLVFCMLFTLCPVISYGEEPENNPAQEEPALIPVTRSMLGSRGSQTGQYAPYALFDEFSSISYPPDQASGYEPPIDSELAVNLNTWRLGGSIENDWADPSLTVDLKREVRLQEIYLYDGEKYAPSQYNIAGEPYEVQGGKFHVYAGDTLLLSYTLTNEGKWVRFVLDGEGVVTQTLKFVKESTGQYYWSNPDWSWGQFGPFNCDANIAEVALYGVSLGEAPPPDHEEPEEPEPEPQDPPDFGFTFKDFVGTNGFFVDNLENYANIGFVREYHNWVWTEASAGEGFAQTASTQNPDVMFTNRWTSFDSYYRNLKELGVGVNLCIQGGVSDTAGLSGTRPSYQGDQDPEKPSSYYAHAASMFQHAARYGSNKNIDPALVKVAAGTTKEIGLGLVKYYENWNEPNATWEAPGNQFTAAQFAAMASADYDGHMGTMGPGVGVKNADPDAKFVMGGLVGLSTDYIKEMHNWFKANRTPEQWLQTHDTLDGYVMYPFDVINLHYYCPDGTAPTGLSPEADNLYERVTEVVDFRNRYYPQAEIWLSEFGWDTTQGSPQSATVEYLQYIPSTGEYRLRNEGINPGLDGKEVQGRWLVREYLILAAAGIDRAQQFMMPDAGGGSGRFASSGMIEEGTLERKPSWYYVGTMKFWLGSTRFEKALETGQEDLLAYQFREALDLQRPDDRVIALWNTTSLNRPESDYELTLPEGTQYAYAVTLEDKLRWGEVTELPIVNGRVTVGVSEKPVFVLAYEEELQYDGSVSDKPKDYDGNTKVTGNYLLDEDFNELAEGVFDTQTAELLGLSFYGASVQVVSEENPYRSKALKLTMDNDKDRIEFDLAGVGDQILPGREYVLDYWLKISDGFTMPGLLFTDNAQEWTYLFQPRDDKKPFTFWSRWWGEYKVTGSTWNRMAVKFRIKQEGGYTYSITLNGQEQVSYDIQASDLMGSLPTDRIRIFFDSGSVAKHSLVYLDDISLYEPGAPSSDLWFEETFDSYPVGVYPGRDGVFTTDNGYYSVVSPAAGEPGYTPSGKVLKSDPGLASADYFQINDSGTMNAITPGSEFIVEFRAWVEQAGTTPYLGWAGQDWNPYFFIDQNWQGKISLPYMQNGQRLTLPGDYALTPGQWHRFAVKMRGVEGGIAYEVYIDDMTQPLVVSEAAGVPLPLRYFRMGIASKNTNGVAYLDDFLIYKGSQIAVHD